MRCNCAAAALRCASSESRSASKTDCQLGIATAKPSGHRSSVRDSTNPPTVLGRCACLVRIDLASRLLLFPGRRSRDDAYGDDRRARTTSLGHDRSLVRVRSRDPVGSPSGAKSAPANADAARAAATDTEAGPVLARPAGTVARFRRFLTTSHPALRPSPAPPGGRAGSLSLWTRLACASPRLSGKERHRRGKGEAR